MQVGQEPSTDVPQPTRDPMAIHRRTDGLADDQPHVRSAGLIGIVRPPDMNDDIGLRRANPVLHRRVKLR